MAQAWLSNAPAQAPILPTHSGHNGEVMTNTELEIATFMLFS